MMIAWTPWAAELWDALLHVIAILRELVCGSLIEMMVTVILAVWRL